MEKLKLDHPHSLYVMDLKLPTSKTVKSVTDQLFLNRSKPQSATDMDEAYATYMCPSCGNPSTVTQCVMLAPNEIHTEKCIVCEEQISMKYNDSGDWELTADNR